MSRLRRAAILAVAGLGAAAFTLLGGACRRVPEPVEPPPAVAAVLETTPPAPVEDASYGLRDAERAAVESFLRDNTDLRVATDADQRKAENDDLPGCTASTTRTSCAETSTTTGFSTSSSPSCAGTPTGTRPGSRSRCSRETASGFAPGTFLERDVSLADGDLSVDRDSIMITPDLEDESRPAIPLGSERRLHVFVRDDADEEPPSAVRSSCVDVATPVCRTSGRRLVACRFRSGRTSPIGSRTGCRCRSRDAGCAFRSASGS